MKRVRLLLFLAAIVVPACGPGGSNSAVPLAPPGNVIVQVYPKGWTGAEPIEHIDGMGLSPDVAFSANGVGFAA